MREPQVAITCVYVPLCGQHVIGQKLFLTSRIFVLELGYRFLQFCLTSPALNTNSVIGAWQRGNCCASEPGHLSCSLPTGPPLVMFHFSEQLKYLQVKITGKYFHPFFSSIIFKFMINCRQCLRCLGVSWTWK